MDAKKLCPNYDMIQIQTTNLDSGTIFTITKKILSGASNFFQIEWAAYWVNLAPSNHCCNGISIVATTFVDNPLHTH